MRVKVLGSFDIDARSFRIGDVVELAEELAQRLTLRRIVEPLVETFASVVPEKPSVEKKSRASVWKS